MREQSMLVRLARYSLLLTGLAALAVWILGYWFPLYLRTGSFAKLPMTTLASVRGQLRLERVHSIPVIQNDAFDHAEHLSFGYVVFDAPLACLHSAGVLAKPRDSCLGLCMPYDMIMTCPPPPQGSVFYRQPSSTRFSRHYAPFWPLPLLLLAYPAGTIAVCIIRRCRRHNVPVCKTCHYNLTGNTSGICPECGEAVNVVNEKQE
jgi:hypothetical protein